MNVVDFNWYLDVYISTAMGEVSPAERDNFRAALTQQNLTFGMIAGALFFQLVTNAILAAYLNFATKADDNNLNGFTDWFGFTWWVSLPMVIGFIASILMLIISSNPEMPMGSLNPLTLSYLLSIDMQSTWFGFTNAIRPDLILTMYLLAVGISRWTDFESKKIYLIAFTPFALFFIVWILVLI